MHFVAKQISFKTGLVCFFVVMMTMFASATAENLPLGWTNKNEIPEKHSRLVTCADLGNAICQYWMGRLWVGEDFLSGPFTAPSEIFNPDAARGWLHSAALQGHRRAMRDYGNHVCDNAYRAEPATSVEIVEGIAWMVAANDFKLDGLDINDALFCEDFAAAIKKKILPKQATLQKALARAKKIKREIESNSVFEFKLFEPCTPLSWIDEINPSFDFFNICLRMSNLSN